MKINRTVALLLALCMVLSILPPLQSNAATVTASGKYSYSISWSLDSDGVLTVTGTGAMPNYTFYSDIPWNDYKSSVTSIVIGDGIASISSYAFYYFENVTSVTIGKDVTLIEDWAFSNCRNLKSITLPDNLVTIEEFAFQFCDELESVDLGDNLVSLGSYAFSYCEKLASVSLPGTLVTIDEGAFYNCFALTLVVIPNSVTTIGRSAFQSCSSVSSLTIGNNVASIGEYAFLGCSKVKTVVIPQSVTSIGASAFDDTDLTKVTYCGTAEQWNQISISQDNAQLADAQLQYHAYDDATCTVDKTCTICGVTEAATEHSWLDATCATAKMCSVCGATEGETTGVHNYIDGMCTLCGKVGGTCGDDATWTLEGGVLTISGTGEMEGYTAGEAPWYEIQEQIVSVVVEEGITKVGSYAFYGLTNLTAFELAASVTYLDLYAFANCTGLKDVVVPGTVETIYLGVFSGCSSLENMTLPFVGAQALEYDEYTQFPFGYIFGRDNYEGSTSVVQYYQGENQSFVLYTEYFVPSSLRTVVITGGNIHYGAFYGCKMLTSITLPETTSAIDSVAFCGCSALQTLTIPASVTVINANAFLNASGLHTVVFVGDAPAMEEEAFKGRTVTAYYPVGNETWTEEVMQNYGGSITWVVDCEHTWAEATCEAPKTCTICGETEGEALGHSWVDATCTAPKTCTVCGETEGEALGHSWVDATCETAKTCTVCGETEGEALGHTFEDHICFCGMIDDEQALIAAIELSGDGKITAFDAQILAEAKAGLRTLTDEQWEVLGDLSPADIIDYILE